MGLIISLQELQLESFRNETVDNIEYVVPPSCNCYATPPLTFTTTIALSYFLFSANEPTMQPSKPRNVVHHFILMFQHEPPSYSLLLSLDIFQNASDVSSTLNVNCIKCVRINGCEYLKGILQDCVHDHLSINKTFFTVISWKKHTLGVVYKEVRMIARE